MALCHFIVYSTANNYEQFGVPETSNFCCGIVYFIYEAFKKVDLSITVTRFKRAEGKREWERLNVVRAKRICEKSTTNGW